MGEEFVVLWICDASVAGNPR